MSDDSDFEFENSDNEDERMAELTREQETKRRREEEETAGLPAHVARAFVTPGAAQCAAREFKKFLRSETVTNLETIGDNLMQWRFVAPASLFDSDSDLHKDLQTVRYSGPEGAVEKGVLFHVSLPPNFPTLPPYIRVVYPRFAFRSGHVTLGGSICMHLLTTEGWRAYTFEAIVHQIVSEMVAGGGRLEKGKNTPYGEGEAKEAYLRMARTHNWDISGILPGS